MVPTDKGAVANVIDWALFPVFILAPTLLAIALVDSRALEPALVGPLVLVLSAAALAVIERARPERESQRPLDQPIAIEVGHFFLSFELGFTVASALALWVGAHARAIMPAIPSWPDRWPLALQLLVAVLVFEGTTYWQHRLLHTWPALFRFHALHHSGARLNLVRAVRFHAVDIGSATLISYAVLHTLAAPERLLAILSVLLGVVGLVQHSNMRVRTPRWLDAMVCTPAVHRLHHSTLRAEHDMNYGNTVMIFDRIFGTFLAPAHPEGPAEIGLEDDPVGRTLYAQIVGPFRRSDAAGE